MAKPLQIRLGPDTLADLDALAASAETRSQAVREAVHYWHQHVAGAAAKNAADLTADEWRMLAHTGDPATFGVGDDGESGRYPDWSHTLALEMVGMWEGRPVLLPSHKEEKAAAVKLARRIADWGPVRGYAIMAAVRWFWRHSDTADAWWWPEVWMIAETRETD